MKEHHMGSYKSWNKSWQGENAKRSGIPRSCFPALSVVGALIGGAAVVAKAVNDA